MFQLNVLFLEVAQSEREWEENASGKLFEKLLIIDLPWWYHGEVRGKRKTCEFCEFFVVFCTFLVVFGDVEDLHGACTTFLWFKKSFWGVL